MVHAVPADAASSAAGLGSGLRRAWRRAVERGATTPASRNRYVDFLRAASIVVVVLGHWLMAAPAIERDTFTLSDMLHVAPWSQWLTWIFQVMPLFFIVGGYANAASWSSHRAAGRGYGAWVSRRLQRLVRPMLPLLVVWLVLAVTARWLGLSARIVAAGSNIVLLPLWFLAVYVIVVVMAPLTHGLYRRLGARSFWALALAAAIAEALARWTGLEWVGLLNYAFVWLTLHQFGHVWRYGGFGGSSRSLLLAAGSFVTLLLLRSVGGYPVSMVTVPGDPVSNTNPPTLALLALGITHGGLVLAAETPARRWLEGRRAWAATVLVNSSILTLYVWHTPAMVLLVALLEWPGEGGLTLTPNSLAWWLTRPLWVAILLGFVALAVAAFGRFEATPSQHAERAAAAWRSVLGAVAVCGGLLWLASAGISAANVLGLNVVPVAVTLAGVLLITGAGPRAAPG